MTGFKRSLMTRFSRFIGFVLTLSVAVLNFTSEMIAVRSLPQAVFIETTAGVESAASVQTGAGASFGLSPASAGGVVTVADNRSERLSARRLRVRLFGIFELASIPVFASEREELIPCGNAVGISIRTDGVLIVGFNAVSDKSGSSLCPAEKSGLRAGDIILAVNGSPVTSAEELQLALNAHPESALIRYERGGRIGTLSVTPLIGTDGGARIGAWVRDSTIGIGTLSFITADSHYTAALGHSVVDADTGKLLPVRTGETVLAEILGVTRGIPGMPGELKGTFSAKSEYIGAILANTALGVFGKCEDAAPLFTPEAAAAAVLPVAFPNEVHTGNAYIFAQVDGSGPQRYSCSILRASKQGRPDQKGLVIAITDERLLAATGGIVQGMSGSPIIQDGRLAGVVTHVFVNDPTHGYGIYAYWMLDECRSSAGGF